MAHAPVVKRELFRRTWELELLVSGAVVIGLFQLPSVVDNAFMQVAPHLSSELRTIPFLAYYLSTAAIYALTSAFMLHLLLRGFWVGLIGLGSAFPDGIHWDRLKLGPVMRATQQEELIGIDRVEAMIDRTASTLFSVLFSVLAMLTVIGMYSTVSSIAAVILVRLGFVSLSVSATFMLVYYLLLGCLFGPMVIFAVIDRLLARSGKTPKSPWFKKAVRASFRIFNVGFLAFLWMPIVYVLSSNLTREGRKVGWRQSAVVIAVILLPFLMFFAGEFGPRLMSRFHSYVYVPPGPNPFVHDPDLYETTRDATERPRHPLIESEIVSGPYLRLFLPYRPRNDNPVLAELCPGFVPFYADGTLAPREAPDDVSARANEALACFQQLYSIELDQQPIYPDYIFSSHQASEVRGLLTRINVADLNPGRHQIVVTKLSSAGEDDAEDPVVTWLPFWR